MQTTTTPNPQAHPNPHPHFPFSVLIIGTGFSFLANSYADTLTDETANLEACRFWAHKASARITDPAKHNILALLESPH
jgi:hypothetical protein